MLDHSCASQDKHVHFEQVGDPLHADGWFGLTGKSAAATPKKAAVSTPSLLSRLTGRKKTTVPVPNVPTAGADVTNLSNSNLFTKVLDDSQPWKNAKNEGHLHYAILQIFNEKHFVYLSRPIQDLWKFDKAGRPSEWNVKVCLDDISAPVVFGNMTPEDSSRWIERILMAEEVQNLVYIKHPTEFFKATWNIQTNVTSSWLQEPISSASLNPYMV